MNNNEHNYMNLVKAFAIIAVVIGHTPSPIKDIIYMYHMPLFFFVSGYFYKDKYSIKPIPMILKRIKKLYLPFVTYECIFLIFRNIFFKLGIYNLNVNKVAVITSKHQLVQKIESIFTMNTGEPLLGTFWFLITLLFVNILFNIISFTFERLPKKHEIVRFIIILGFYFLGFYMLKRGINLNQKFNHSGNMVISLCMFLVDYDTFKYMFIYYIGYLYFRNKDKIPNKSNIAIIAAITMIIISKFNITIKHLYPLFYTMNAMLGIYLNIYISNLIIIKGKNCKLLNYIGKNTLIIMSLHFISFKAASLIIMYIYKMPLIKLAEFPVITGISQWWSILYIIMGLFIPLLVQYLYDSLKKLMQGITVKIQISNSK